MAASPAFIGHVNVEHLVCEEFPLEHWNLAWISLSVSLGCHDAFVVQEFGSEMQHAHYHYYFETSKSKTTVFNKLKKVFSSPGKVAPAQQVSCKVPDQAKLGTFFRYLCKGPNGRAAESVAVVLDISKCRMVEQLHEAFHAQAAEIRDVRTGKRSPSAWYESLAAQCVEKGAITRDDVMQVVSHYYVYDSKKGFDKFAVTRTFWAVFALVNGMECHALLLSQCMDMVRV